MNEQRASTRTTGGRDLLRARLKSIKFSRRSGVIGPAELIGLAGSVLILILVIVGYLYFLVPTRFRLESLQSERSRLQGQLRSSQDVVRQGQTTEATVQNITESMDAFESRQLLGANRGRMSLYDSLNELIRKNGLRNTSGPTYTPLEPAGSKIGTSGTRTANTKWQSIYPGIAISVTVEGPYQNLRRFIRDIETNKQFVIINSIELERSTENSAPPGDGASGGAPRGSLVSLRLEMATYFQRGSMEGVQLESAGH
jgi:Tfp pilus assembly protein PilO